MYVLVVTEELDEWEDSATIGRDAGPLCSALSFSVRLSFSLLLSLC